LTAGKVPGGSERMPPAHGIAPEKNSSSSCSSRWNSLNNGLSPDLKVVNMVVPPLKIWTARKTGVGQNIFKSGCIPPETYGVYELTYGFFSSTACPAAAPLKNPRGFLNLRVFRQDAFTGVPARADNKEV